MQWMKWGLLIFLLPTVTLAGNRWNVTLPGGSMRFQGVVIAEACSVAASDRMMTVTMGQISSHRFHAVGEESRPIAFDIHLEDCSTEVSQRVGVSFQGVADGKDPNILSVGEGAGIATGIGISLFDDQGGSIPLNQAPVRWTKLNDGPTTLHFVAKYRSTDRQVVGGTANAQAWFALTYE